MSEVALYTVTSLIRNSPLNPNPGLGLAVPPPVATHLKAMVMPCVMTHSMHSKPSATNWSGFGVKGTHIYGYKEH